MTKTQSREMRERAEDVARWMRDTGDFTAEQVEAADMVADAIRREREEWGYE